MELEEAAAHDSNGGTGEEDFKPGEAASRLLEHYKSLPTTSPTVVVPLLMQMDPRVLVESYRKMLAGGGNGTREEER